MMVWLGSGPPSPVCQAVACEGHSTAIEQPQQSQAVPGRPPVPLATARRHPPGRPQHLDERVMPAVDVGEDAVLVLQAAKDGPLRSSGAVGPQAAGGEGQAGRGGSAAPFQPVRHAGRTPPEDLGSPGLQQLARQPLTPRCQGHVGQPRAVGGFGVTPRPLKCHRELVCRPKALREAINRYSAIRKWASANPVDLPRLQTPRAVDRGHRDQVAARERRRGAQGIDSRC